MVTADSEHSRVVLQMVAQRAGVTELRKMLRDKEKSIILLKEQIGFCEISIDVFTKELEAREKI